MNKTKIELHHGNKIITITLPWDVTSDEMVEAFFGMLVTAGYHEQSITYSMENINK